MANIPGISGYIQPGTFARDRVVSKSVSIPGGLRVACIMGEGLKEEVLVESAVGNGQDGSSACSPSGTPDGRYFQISGAPLVSGRAEIYLNGNQLFGYESEIDQNSFERKYDFRLDPATGCLELQSAGIADQNGKGYSSSSLNVGNGVILQDSICSLPTLDVVDTNTPPERWTVRCVSVIRDSSGTPISGLSTFTVSGSISGQLKDSSGQPILFHGTAFVGTAGAVSGNASACTDGFVVASSDDFGLGYGEADSGDSTTDTVKNFTFSGNLVEQGQVLAGDYLCITDGYTEEIAIESISYDSSLDKTTLVLLTDTLTSDIVSPGVNWKIKATNLFIDDPSVSHDGLTGDPVTAGNFSSKDIGKVIQICSGTSQGRYVIKNVTSSRRARLYALGNSTSAFPEMQGDINGLGESGLRFSLLETNGVLLLGIKEGTVPFSTGDKFFIDVDSRALKRGDKLEARYISEIDINDAEFFNSANDLFAKHGTPSTTNTLSLGAQLAFENGAPGVLAIQCKPAVPRRTNVTLLSSGFTACGSTTGSVTNCQIDDLSFVIPKPISGLGMGRPDGDTSINFFVIRNGKETQIFPNKVPFYNSQLESESAQSLFVNSPDYAYSYTVVNTDTKITAVGDSGIITKSNDYFTSLFVDFNAEDRDNGRIIVVESLHTSSGDVYTTSEDIANHLFGDSSLGVELLIKDVINDNTVLVACAADGISEIINDAESVQFFVKDPTNTSTTSAKILLHKDLVSSGTIKYGDGIRITYIDETDSTFFDTNWFEALEALEASECQILVPLPLQNRSGIFRSAVAHCEAMSSIANKKERMAFIGAQIGLTTAALIGTKEVAIEDIGVLEGIQGDDPEEVLSSNVEDLANYKLSDNYNSNRCVFFYPDRVVKNVNGTNSYLDGFYISAAAAGYLSSLQNVAVPLTFKELTGFSITRDRVYRKSVLDQLGGAGATVLQPISGGGKVLAGRTTSHSGFVEDEEISIVFIRDRVKQVLRESLLAFVGTVEDQNTQGVITARVKNLMSALVSQNLITDFKNVRVEKDKVDPRQWNVFLQFVPSYPINYIFIDIEVGVI